MLAQNFKTPTDLGISDVDFETLVKVLGMLERREIAPEKFNMAQVNSNCGTIHCIQGWCQKISGGAAFPLMRPMPEALSGLFMYCDHRRFCVTTGQAAIALRNYLTFGDSQWDEVFPK